jgi:hypothetical protein
LGALLDAAKAPASTGELAGERAAVAGFAAARRVTAPPKRGKNRVRVPLPARTVAMKVAAGVAVLAVSGTALAARTGNLPDAAQQRAHAMFEPLGVPGPAPSPSTSGTATSGSPARTSATSTSPAPSRTPTSVPSDPAAAGAISLCRIWVENDGKGMPAPSRKRLKDLAGKQKDIAAYCAGLLAGASPAATPGASPSASPTPAGNNNNGRTHGPGNGDGNTNSNGKGNGPDDPEPDKP